MTVRLVGAELFHAERRTDGEIDRLTDVAKLSVTFLNFASSPKKHIAIQHCWIYTCFNLHINLLVESNV